MNKEGLKKIGLLCGVLILILIVLYSGLQILESTVLRSRDPQPQEQTSKTITVAGVDYYPRQDITVFMALGIDQFGPMKSSGFNRNVGCSDMIILLILDDTNQTYHILHLNRDTMVDMQVLGLGNKPAGTTHGQLALAYTYGDGLESSCENVRTTVSRLLGGVEIDHYVAMNMDAISILNDAVGGVTVTVDVDFSEVDPSLTMGQVHLMGQQAISYVRTRREVGDHLNLSRISRQKEYMEGFLASFRQAQKSDPSLLLDTYEQVSAYLVTDCSVNVISSLMDRCADYQAGRMLTTEGENNSSGRFMEFYPDEEALRKLVLELFYAEK